MQKKELTRREYIQFKCPMRRYEKEKQICRSEWKTGRADSMCSVITDNACSRFNYVWSVRFDFRHNHRELMSIARFTRESVHHPDEIQSTLVFGNSLSIWVLLMLIGAARRRMRVNLENRNQPPMADTNAVSLYRTHFRSRFRFLCLFDWSHYLRAHQ